MKRQLCAQISSTSVRVKRQQSKGDKFEFGGFASKQVWPTLSRIHAYEYIHNDVMHRQDSNLMVRVNCPCTRACALSPSATALIGYHTHTHTHVAHVSAELIAKSHRRLCESVSFLSCDMIA